jgi:hypothetical protein
MMQPVLSLQLFNFRDAAVFYCFILYILFRGRGPLRLDSLLTRQKPNESLKSAAA